MHPHDFWQHLDPPASHPPAGPWRDLYPVTLADGRRLSLPIRPLGDGRALCSLILNQAGFEVADALAADVAARLAPFEPEVVVGLPTLGLTLAADVARALGHRRYVPLGTSRKFWYSEEQSVPLSSITTPGGGKRLYVDPRMLPLLAGRRVALVDDVISSGASIVAGLRLLALVGIAPVAIGAAMLQSDRWRPALSALDPDWPGKVRAAFATPILMALPDGLWTEDAKKAGPGEPVRPS